MSAETVPAFVFRGLTALSGPDLSSIHWRTEADLRDVLATYMWFAGVESVRTEVQVADCGRIDVLADEGKRSCVIEIKRSITTVSAARKAYQQAETYRLYMQAEKISESTDYWPVSAIVVAAEWNDDAVVQAERAFTDVEGSTYSEATANVSWFGFPDPHQGVQYRSERRGRIVARRELVQRLLTGLDVADREWAAAFERTSLHDVEQVA